MRNKIILLSGSTGVGTSTYSLILANMLNIYTIIGTDSIREVIRSILHSKINPTLEKSTYLAGQTKNYANKDEAIQRAEIIRAYKTQCDAVDVGIEGLIKRAKQENTSLILEGVHLRPGKLIESKILNEDETLEFLLYICDEKVHKRRFEQRQQQAPERMMKKYIDNFREIRWIHDYLFERAKHAYGVCLINNSKSIEDGIKIIEERLTK